MNHSANATTPTPAPSTKTVTISCRLQSGRYLTRTLEVTDTPRPPGRCLFNHRSVWIHRAVRSFYGVGAHPPGDWVNLTSNHLLTPSRRRLIERIAKEQS